MRSTEVKKYSKEPLLKHPVTMLRELLISIHAGRSLAWALFMRDLKAQYRQTYLGYVWAFVPPLAASLTFIFLHSQGIVQVSTGDIPYAAFVMIGTLLWQVFVDSIASPSQNLMTSKPMLIKINFPREAIFISGFYMVLFNFLIRMLLVIAVLLWWQIPITSSVIFFPVAVFGLFACGMAIGLAIAPVGGLYGDVTRAIPVVAQFWMLLTPVVYPAREEGLLGILSTWNPVSPIIVTARESLTGQALSMLPEFTIVTISAMVFMLFWLIVFRMAVPHLIERMGG